jgi:hypothetical protein
MKRHPFDLTSLLFGVVFGAAAAVYLLADPLAWDIDERWVLPVALILLGIAGIAGALSNLRSNRAAADPTPDEEPETATAISGSAGDSGEL